MATARLNLRLIHAFLFMLESTACMPLHARVHMVMPYAVLMLSVSTTLEHYLEISHTNFRQTTFTIIDDESDIF